MPDGAVARLRRDPRRGGGGDAGARADRIVGKPEPVMYEAARDRLGPGRALAVGDRLDTDVAGARRGRASTRRSC